jgi:hypothetical protein
LERYIVEKPTNYDEAWNHPDPWQRDKWGEAMKGELKKMSSHIRSGGRLLVYES